MRDHNEQKKVFKSLYFQDEVHKQLMKKFCNQSQECGILKLPTGAGKTFVASKFVTERYLKNGERILWVAHRWTHINHFLKTLSDIKGQDPSIDFDVVLIGDIQNILRDNLTFKIEKYDSFVPTKATVYISSTQSISRSLKVPSKLNLIIFDEDHWGKNGAMREKILWSGGGVATLGLTATPIRSNYSQSPSIIGHEYSYLRLASEGYLAKAVSTIFNTKKTYIVDKQGLKKAQINRLIRNQSIKDVSRMEAVINFYASNMEFFGKTFIFCPNAS
jgi:superfamily II DNA or RNA helicase